MNNPKLSRFYLLPKIDKTNASDKPVISNSSYFTENISSFLDFHLKLSAQKVKSYIKDTNEILEKIANLPPLPDHFVLSPIDGLGLYPNIRPEKGLIAIREALDTRKDQTISTDSLTEFAECVLKNNIFECDNSVFKQIRGTKMGPPYAIIFMNSLEEGILSNSLLKPLVWWRYTDNIFMMREHGEEGLQNFLEPLHCYHPIIKFTAEYSRAKSNFLDVTVMKKGNHLVTNLDVKSTDTRQCLYASLCHISHCKKSMPFSQALRLNRICSGNVFFDKQCNELEVWLKERSYSDNLVRGNILKAKKF